MMAKDPAFLFYSKDFLTGVIFMTNEQVGIYIKLLCIQHQHSFIDKTFFNDNVKAHHCIRTKFKESEDGFYNERLLEEMLRRKEKSATLSKNAQKRWEKERKNNANAPDLHMPIGTVNANVNVNKDNIIKASHFEEIWELYPAKTGKKAAQKHFLATVKTIEDLDRCRKSLENYKSSARVSKGFIQNGSTWFNNWEDWEVLPENEVWCAKCKNTGKFTSNRGYECVCDCPAGKRAKI